MRLCQHPRAVELSQDEWRLVRLFRCMIKDEQSDMLIKVTHQLMRKYSVDPDLSKFQPIEDTLRDELNPENVENFDERLLSAWPGNWSGRKFVELDNVGDPGAFLEKELIEGISRHILGASEYDSSSAELLAESYLENISELGYQAYRDSCDTDEEKAEADQWQRTDTINDFIGFIKEWRERVVTTIERQAKVNRGDSDISRDRHR